MDDLNALLSQLDKTLDLDPFKVDVPTFKVPNMAEVARMRDSNTIGRVYDPFGSNPFSLDPLNTGDANAVVTIERDEEQERLRSEQKERAKEDKDKGKKVLISTVNDPNARREEEKRKREEEEAARLRLEAVRSGEKPPPTRRRRQEGEIYWTRRPVKLDEPAPQPGVPQPSQGDSQVAVHLTDGQVIQVRYSRTFLSEQLVANIGAQLNLSQSYLFDLSVPRSDGSDFWLPRATDLTSVTPQHRLYLKCRYFKTPRAFTCPASTRLLYLQVRASVVSGKYPVSLRTAVKLAALQIASEHGTYAHVVQKKLSLDLSALLPHRGLPQDYYWTRVLHALRLLEAVEPFEAMKAYLALARNTPMYGVQVFAVRYAGRDAKLGVAEDGLMLPQKTPNAAGVFLPFDRMHQWETPNERTLRVVQAAKRDDPLIFEAQEGAMFELVELLTTYYCMALDLSGDIPDLPLTYEVEPSTIPNPAYYRPSVTRFAFESTQITRLHVFREKYLAGCQEDGTTPSKRLIMNVIDRALDEESVLDLLDASQCEIDTKHLMTLIRALRLTFQEDVGHYEHFEDNLMLNGIDLSGNKLDKSSIDALTELLSLENPWKLKVLKLNDNMLKKGGCVKLAPALEKYSALKELHMKRVGMGAKGFEKIVDGMKFNGNLVTFDFEDNGIDDGAHKLLGNMMAKNGHLLLFNMSGNKLGDQSGKWFTEGMKQNTVLQHLAFNGVGWGNNFCKKLAKWVEKLDKVLRFELADNNVGSNAAVILAKRIEVAPRLQFINLNNGSIGSAGAKQIAESLALSKSLREIDVGRNSFSGSGEALVEAMGKNLVCSKYRLAETSLGKEAMGRLADLLISSRHITVLDVSGNELTTELAQKWGEAIGQAHSLSELYLSGCVKEKDLEPVLAGVKRHPRLQMLQLNDMNYKNALNGSILAWLNDPELALKVLHLQNTSIDIKLLGQFLLATHTWNNRWLDTLNVDNNKLDAKKGGGSNLEEFLQRVPFDVVGVLNLPDPTPNFASYGDPISSQSLLSRDQML